MRPFRSVLYMPGSNERALEKAKSLQADALILDLEDACAPDSKTMARDLIVKAVNAGGYRQRFLMVRVNGADTEWHAEDISEIANCSPHAILLPKVENPEQIQNLATEMSKSEGYSKTKIWAMIETPLGVLNAKEISTSSNMLEGFVLGTNDLVKDMHAIHVPDRSSVLPALTISILAARANGLICLDGVYNDFKDAVGFDAECTQGRALGFDGKTLIHPAQIEGANVAFGPSEEDIAEAKTFVAAFDEAMSQGQAVAVVNGRIVENLHVENARRLLAQSAAIAEMAN